jgi:hypothetical protein
MEVCSGRYPEVIAWFGDGHVHCADYREGSDADADANVINEAIDVIDRVVMEQLVGIRFKGGAGMLGTLEDIERLRGRYEVQRVRSWTGTHDRG